MQSAHSTMKYYFLTAKVIAHRCTLYVWRQNGKLPTADINVNRFFRTGFFYYINAKETNYLICH